MHRPNRIGEHIIADMSAPVFTLPQSAAEFTASEGTKTLARVQTDTALLGDPVSTINFTNGDAAETWNLSSGKSWSFGRFIKGGAINDREVMIAYAAQIEVITQLAASKTSVALYMGVANATSVTVDITAAVNLMDTRVLLKTAEVPDIGSLMHRINVKGTILNTLFNGGASGIYDDNPIGMWLQITSFGGSQVIQYLTGSMSLYKYSKDIDTFDPTR